MIPKWKRCTFMRHLECSVNLKGCLELGLKTVGFSVIDLAKDCVQIMQLTHWCRPSWLTRTMCLLWQKTWKNNLRKGFYYSMDFTYVVLLWDCWKFSNHTCKGRAHKVLPSVWDHFWAFHRGKKRWKSILLLSLCFKNSLPRHRLMTSHVSSDNTSINFSCLKTIL